MHNFSSVLDHQCMIEIPVATAEAFANALLLTKCALTEWLENRLLKRLAGDLLKRHKLSIFMHTQPLHLIPIAVNRHNRETNARSLSSLKTEVGLPDEGFLFLRNNGRQLERLICRHPEFTNTTQDSRQILQIESD